MEGISSHRGYPRAGMVALSRFAYDLQKEMPDFKSLRADFYDFCDPGRRLVLHVLKVPISNYERRVYFRKKLYHHKHSHLPKPLNQQELLKQIIDIPHTISLSYI